MTQNQPHDTSKFIIRSRTRCACAKWGFWTASLGVRRPPAYATCRGVSEKNILPLPVIESAHFAAIMSNPEAHSATKARSAMLVIRRAPKREQHNGWYQGHTPATATATATAEATTSSFSTATAESHVEARNSTQEEIMASSKNAPAEKAAKKAPAKKPPAKKAAVFRPKQPRGTKKAR